MRVKIESLYDSTQFATRRGGVSESWSEYKKSGKLLTALRSLSTSRILWQPELPGYWLGLSTIDIYSTKPFLLNTTPSTILKLTISAPSSKLFTDVGGIEPGRMPPISAWWPRDAVKKIICFDLGLKTGVMIVSYIRKVANIEMRFKEIGLMKHYIQAAGLRWVRH